MLKNIYALANERYVKKTTQETSVKKGPLDSYKFRLEPSLEVFVKKKISMPLRFKATPDTLTELTANVVRKIPLPTAHKWTNNQVLAWIEKLGFPEYKNTFYVNHITGHSLIYVDASALIAMNITKQTHITKITSAIRELYGIEMIKHARSISLPPRYPLTHYKYYRANTGTKYQDTDAIYLFRKMKLIRPPPSYDEHWTTLEKWLTHEPPVEFERIGYAPRQNLYKPKKCIPVSSASKKSMEMCSCTIPPCTCKWSEKHYRKSWRQAYLKKYRDTTVINRAVESCSAGEHHNTCAPICTCDWNAKEFLMPLPLEILRKSLKKYTKFTVSQGSIKNKEPIHTTEIQKKTVSRDSASRRSRLSNLITAKDSMITVKNRTSKMTEFLLNINRKR